MMNLVRNDRIDLVVGDLIQIYAGMVLESFIVK